MGLPQIWAHLVGSERGEWRPFARRSSSPVERPFDRQKYPALAQAMDDWLDGSALSKHRRWRRLRRSS
jgi:hypothetical protein